MTRNKISYDTIFSLFIVLLLVAVVALAVQHPTVDAAANYSNSNIYQFNSYPLTRDQVPGATARLVRNPDGATAQLLTERLTPGDAVSLWWVIFNNPAACAAHPAPCTLQDLFGNTAAVGGEVIYGTGQIIGDSGKVAYGSRLPASTLSRGWFGNGFTNPIGAEIHLLVYSHGPVIADLAEEMLTTFHAGCQDNALINQGLMNQSPINQGLIKQTLPAHGTPGPNQCQVMQFAIFQPQQ